MKTACFGGDPNLMKRGLGINYDDATIMKGNIDNIATLSSGMLKNGVQL